MSGAPCNSAATAPSNMTMVLNRLAIQVRQARAVTVMLGATSRSADIDADDVTWAADCAATLLDQVLADLAGASKGSAAS